jgi:hypothetical protein
VASTAAPRAGAGPQPPHLGQVVRARTLAIDALAAQVIATFERRDIPAMLMKGAVVAEWLYTQPGDIRPYGDADILVAPRDETAAARVLLELGFENDYSSFEHPRIGAQSWRRAPWEAIDLQTTLWGIGAEPEQVWDAFNAGSTTQRVGGRLVTVPGVPVRAFQLSLHAAQHAGATRTVEDLERAIEAGEHRDWQEAARIADALDATGAFVTGLRLCPSGDRLADELGLPAKGSLDARLRLGAVPLAEGFQDLAAANGIRAKAELVAREVWPNRDFLRWWSPTARRGAAGLAAARCWRIIWLAARAPAGFVAWRRAKRAGGA